MSSVQSPLCGCLFAERGVVRVLEEEGLLRKVRAFTVASESTLYTAAARRRKMCAAEVDIMV